MSQMELIFYTQKSLTSRAAATLTATTKLPTSLSAAPPAPRGPANLPDKLIATGVHSQRRSRSFYYEYKAVVQAPVDNSVCQTSSQ